ncbi:MAG: fibronectin type III domain-containing protein [Acidobacteriaceae bacterium]|nr:fibronectin type III domain-containing protein [Acidobacteriaceae bacterium]
MAVDPDGTVYAAGMGGAVATRSAATASALPVSAGAVVATTPTVITVTEAKRGTAPSDNEQANIKPATDQTRAIASSASTTTSNTPVVEVSGVEKSAIYKITPNHAIETLRSSQDDNVYDILLDGDSLIFSTDDRGRIYRLNGQKVTLLAEPGDGETTRLLGSGSLFYAGLSNPGRVLAFGPTGTGSGSYQSPVHDSTSIARWGHLQWHGNGAAPVFRTRTGNATRPDATWSGWSAPITDPADALIKSPPARFIQIRAEWPTGSAAGIDSISIPYLPQNTPPILRSITVTSIIGTNTAKAAANVATPASAYSVTVTDTGNAPATTATTTNTQTVSRLQTTQTQISWQADDPDGDKLVYSVYFRAEDEKQWQLIRSRMFENNLLLDPDVFADGRYFFRVVASDAPSNAAQYARETELVSTPVLIDNTPPAVTLGAPHRDGSSLDIEVQASDQTSPLRLCEYSLDAGFWQPIEATDGVTDSPRETFHLHLDKLRPGEHLLVFRVYDSANNAGLARVLLK